MVNVGLMRALWGVLAFCPGLALELRPAEEQNQTESQQRVKYPDTPDVGLALEAGTISDHQLQLGLKERGLRVPLSWDKFPLWLNDRRQVAKFQRVYHGVHIFTVGVYVDKRCEVWGKKWDTSNFTELLDLAVGNTTVRYEIVSKYLTRTMLAQDLVGKELLEHYRGPDGDRAWITKQHERLMYKGPIFHVGAVLDFVLQEHKVWYLFDEQYIGKAGNHESSKALLGAWLDDRSSKVFRSPLFSSLQRGLDGHSSEMTATTGEDMAAGEMTAAVLVSAVVVFGAAAGCLCCYWRLQRAAEDSCDSDCLQSASF